MRHKVYGKHLSRSKDQRTALFKSLVRSLILEESIKTTESKAKAVKGLVDKIITQAKSDTSRRLVSQFFAQPKVSDKLINEILPRVKSRTSGYTTMVKMGPRLGDGAMIVKMSLLLEEAKQSASKKEVKTPEVIEAEVVEAKPTESAAKSKKPAAKKEAKISAKGDK